MGEEAGKGVESVISRSSDSYATVLYRYVRPTKFYPHYFVTHVHQLLLHIQFPDTASIPSMSLQRFVSQYLRFPFRCCCGRYGSLRYFIRPGVRLALSAGPQLYILSVCLIPLARWIVNIPMNLAFHMLTVCPIHSHLFRLAGPTSNHPRSPSLSMSHSPDCEIHIILPSPLLWSSLSLLL